MSKPQNVEPQYVQTAKCPTATCPDRKMSQPQNVPNRKRSFFPSNVWPQNVKTASVLDRSSPTAAWDPARYLWMTPFAYFELRSNLHTLALLVSALTWRDAIRVSNLESDTMESFRSILPVQTSRIDLISASVSEEESSAAWELMLIFGTDCDNWGLVGVTRKRRK